MRIDLHTHSVVSDGTETPTELVRTAADAGLDAVALTDHDTTAGWAEAVAALPAGLSLVRGAEFSCVSEDGRGGWCSVHLLGYLFDPQAPSIVAEQARLRDERRRRLYRMARRMAGDGLPVDADELLAGLPADSPAGRPHLAMALVRAGVVGSVTEAFDSYLKTGSRYHLPRADTPVDEAIAMIAAAGGVSVLAHAFASSRGRTVTGEVIGELAAVGLTGLEVDHPDHPEPARAALSALAAEHGLLVTGSSDYHGSNKLNRIGVESTPEHDFTELIGKASGVAVVHG